MLKVEWRKYLAVCSCVFVLFGLLFSMIFVNGEVKAHDIDYDVSVDSMIHVILPYNSIVLDLNPNNKPFDHKGMSMLVGSNNPAGYEMTISSVGNATDLVNESDNTKTMETLPTLAAGYTESNFVTNKWGYSLNGANYQPFTSNITLASSSEESSSTVSLEFASKIDYSQTPGVYSIPLRFNAVVHIMPIYMQNLDPTLCTTTPILVADIRDNQQYYIQRLADGNCWMMTNLNLGAVDFINDINQYNTNISGVIEANDFFAWKKNNSGGGTGTLDAGEFYSQTGADPTSDTPYGTLYNYYAASAGTIKGANNTSDATEDICPAGWQMPTAGDGFLEGNYGKLYYSYGTYASMRASMADNGAAFTLSGTFYNGAPTGNAMYGSFWSSSVSDGTGVGMNGLGLDTTNIFLSTHYDRGFGMAIRCVLKEEGNTPSSIVPDLQYFNNMDADLTASVLDNMELDKAYIMRDSRDGQEYKVARLKDGNVWMLDNLRLGGDTAIELTPEDTNIESSWTLPASGTVCFYTSSCTGRDGSGGTIGSTKTGTGYTVPAINASYKDTVASTIYGNGSNKFGVYYNYCAASAGTICSSSVSTSPTQDICPAGWKMPDRTLYSGLYTAYSNATNSRNALSTPLSGYFYSGSSSGRNSYGYYWSSSRYDTTEMYNLNTDSSSFTASGYGYRYYGYSVRCILDTAYNNASGNNDLMDTYNVSTMQELGNISIDRLKTLKTWMEVGKRYELKDSRDNQTYSVAKLNDGNIWMVQNLNLGATDLVQNLNSSNTNISTTIYVDDFNTWKKDSGSASYVDKELIPVSAAGYTLYNYCAASAGTYCYDSESGTGDAVQDLCPAGWRLPTGGSASEFAGLVNSYSASSLISLFGTTYSFSNSTPSSSSIYGYYWSSTFSSATSMIRLYSYSSSPSATYGAVRSGGYAVRCILSEDDDLNLNMTMQDFNNLSSAEKNLVISIMQTGKNYEFRDSRDNQTYTIAKLKDGNVWMTQNLNLGATDLTQDLTSANTNISTTVDAATFNSWRKSIGSQTRIKGEFIPVSGVDSNSLTPYGVLYNYCAASAGTYCFFTENNPLQDFNSTQDLCPAGWELPASKSGVDGLYRLAGSYSSHLTDPIISAGAGFARAGYFDKSSPTNTGNRGFYWASTYNETFTMYRLQISGNASYSNDYIDRYYGYSVRCILKQE